MTPDDWWRLGKSILASVGTFWISYFILISFAPTWSFWLVVLLSFIAASLILAAIDAATNTRSGLGTSIVLFILLQAGLLLAWHYGKTSPDLLGTKNEVVDEDKQLSQISEMTEYNKPGTYPVNLAEGQESNWIKVGPRRSFSFSNQKATFILKFRDGTIANSWDRGPWPDKYEFKVLNLSREQFDIIVY